MSQSGPLRSNSSGAPVIETLTGNAGGPVGPDAGFNINVIGNNTTGINVVGNPVTNTLTVVGIAATASQAGTSVLTTYTEDVGTAVSVGGILNIVGAGTVSTSGAGNTITITSTSSLSWHTTSINIAHLAVNTGYFCISPGGALTLGLPAVSTLGDTVRVSLSGATSWTITQAAGQQILLSTGSTTLGAGGSLSSTAAGDSVELVCLTANTIWVAQSLIGNLTTV